MIYFEPIYPPELTRWKQELDANRDAIISRCQFNVGLNSVAIRHTEIELRQRQQWLIKRLNELYAPCLHVMKRTAPSYLVKGTDKEIKRFIKEFNNGK